MDTPFLIIFHRASAVSAHDVMTSELDQARSYSATQLISALIWKQ